MIDFTKIELNPLPPPIVELRSENFALKGRNNILQGFLIVGGVVLGIYLLNKYALNEDDKNKIKLVP